MGPRCAALTSQGLSESRPAGPLTLGTFGDPRWAMKDAKDTLPRGRGPRQPPISVPPASHTGHHALVALGRGGGQGRVPFLTTAQRGSLRVPLPSVLLGETNGKHLSEIYVSVSDEYREGGGGGQGTARGVLLYIVLSGDTSLIRQRPGKNGSVSRANIWESAGQQSAWLGG